jgi:hypothetical protein
MLIICFSLSLSLPLLSPSGAALASLFGGSGSSDPNTSFSYTAPKQPKKQAKGQPTEARYYKSVILPSGLFSMFHARRIVLFCGQLFS